MDPAIITETCIKCDKLMRAEDGSRIGGIVSTLSFRNETIWSITCWECSLLPNSRIWEEE
jgi:hypothetical protein